MLLANLKPSNYKIIDLIIFLIFLNVFNVFQNIPSSKVQNMYIKKRIKIASSRRESIVLAFSEELLYLSS